MELNDKLKRQASALNSAVQMVKVSAQATDKEIAEFTKANEETMKGNVLADKVRVMRHDAVAEREEDYKEGTDLLEQVKADAALHTREAHLRRSPVMPAAKLPDGITAGDKSIVEAVRANTEEMQRSRLRGEIRDATDRELQERWLPELARDQNPGIAGLLLAEGNKRGGVLGSKIRTAVDAVPLTAYDEAQEILGVIEESALSLESAFHRLRTGGDDTYAKSQAAAAKYRESQQNDAA